MDANDYTEKAWEAMGALGAIADKHESAYVEAEMLLLGGPLRREAHSHRDLSLLQCCCCCFCCRAAVSAAVLLLLFFLCALALLQDGPEGLAHRVLTRAGVSVDKLTEEVERHLERQPRMALGFGDQKVLGRGLQQVLASAQRFKREFRVGPLSCCRCCCCSGDRKQRCCSLPLLGAGCTLTEAPFSS